MRVSFLLASGPAVITVHDLPRSAAYSVSLSQVAISPRMKAGRMLNNPSSGSR
jgi:hypothetical protein